MFYGEEDSQFDNINVAKVSKAVEYDTSLTEPQKYEIDFLLNGGSGYDRNVTSGSDILKATIKGGLGLGAGYLFTKTIGGLANIPAKPLAALSMAGGVGAAILSSGAISDEFSIGSFFKDKYSSNNGTIMDYVSVIKNGIDKQAGSEFTDSLMSVLIGLPFAVGGLAGIGIAAATKDTKANKKMLEYSILESENREAELESRNRLEQLKKEDRDAMKNGRRSIRM